MRRRRVIIGFRWLEKSDGEKCTLWRCFLARSGDEEPGCGLRTADAVRRSPAELSREQPYQPLSNDDDERSRPVALRHNAPLKRLRVPCFYRQTWNCDLGC